MGENTDTYDVLISDSAKAMLYEHTAFLSQVSIPAANKLVDSFERAINSLREYPQRCAVYQTRRTAGKYRRLVFSNRYAILFVIEEKSKIVRIKYIFDTRRDNKQYI